MGVSPRLSRIIGCWWCRRPLLRAFHELQLSARLQFLCSQFRAHILCSNLSYLTSILQATRCRDLPFALLLYGNLAAIIAVAAVYGADAFTDAISDSTSGYDYSGYVYATFILGAVAIILTGVTLPIMMCIPEILIKVSLVLMVVLTGVMAVWFFVAGSIFGGIIWTISFLIFCCYARAVWSRIPFASANLTTACTAIKKNCGVVFVAYFFVLLAFGWTLLWSIALAGVSNQVVTSEEVVSVGGATYTQNSVNWGYLFLLLLSYFFTHQVIQNTTHVTVAGTVGSWWFAPDETSSFCSGGMIGSMIRALTTSFGSICFGSLLVALVQSLKALAQAARDQDNGILICIAECILGCIESILRYFNKWAFVYVGLYGYSYIEAGKNVFTLFKNRGWEAIIADDLVGNVFFFLSLCVGRNHLPHRTRLQTKPRPRDGSTTCPTRTASAPRVRGWGSSSGWSCRAS